MMKKISFFVLLFPMVARSATTWTGPSVITISTWNTAANWSSGTPGPNEQVTFNTSVTIAENVPLTVNNNLVIKATVTIAGSISLTAGDVSLNGGSIVNNGVFNAHNLAYSNTGETITNNNSITLYNLNVGNASKAGTFSNNSQLDVTNNIVVEEGTFTASAASIITVNGITIQSGGNFQNSGTINSTGSTSANALIINSGGTFTNQVNGVLNINLTLSNVYAINSKGTFANYGTANIGSYPVNADSKGILAGSGSNFSNTSKLVFTIDAANCVLTDNTGMSGSFSTTAIKIVSGNNCLNTPLPVKLVSFTGMAASGFNSIKWVVADQSDLSRYELERANADNSIAQWITVSSFAPQTNFTYHYKDYTTDPNSLYRLKAIDLDGKFVYSGIISINNQHTAKTSLLVFPVPATKSIHVSGHIPDKNFTITILNVSGVAVKKYACTNNRDRLDLQYDMGDIPMGTYLLILKNENGLILERKKFIKAG